MTLSNAPAPAETVREAVARAICANTTYTCEDPSCRCVTLMRIRADAVLAAISAHGLALVPVEATGFQEIIAERGRQQSEEGWTPAHDDEHTSGELLTAAVLYLWHGTDRAPSTYYGGAPTGWPWEASWWKPKDRRRNLIRAGALCLAELERLSRTKRSVGHVYHKLGLVLRELAAAPLSPPVGAWKPISEAPKDGTRLLVCGGGCDEVEIGHYLQDVGAWSTLTATLDDTDNEPGGYNRPTRYMLLPPPPIDVKAVGEA